MTIEIQSYILLFSSLFMILIEKKILREKYILFSPYTLANFSFIYIYILPFCFYGNINFQNNINRLPEDQVSLCLSYFQVFYYLFSILSIISFVRIRKTIKYKKSLSYRLSDTFILTSFIILFIITLFGQLILVDFNIKYLILKLLNPREFTYLREGLGPITVIVSYSKLLLLFLSIIYRRQKKNILSIVLFILAILLNFLGGSKSSLLIILIYYILAFQKLRIGFFRISFNKLLLYSSIMILVVLISFNLMSKNKEDSDLNNALSLVIGYSQEAYYSSMVISDFDWDIDHIKTVTEGLFFSPIPRKIFKDKGYYGLYRNYWQPLYQPNVVVYHTSTYGFLAEGHMLFHFLTPLIYALLFNLIFFKIYRNFYITENITTFFFTLIMSTWIYFLIRTGLFMSSSIWTLLLYFIATNYFFKIGKIMQNK